MEELIDMIFITSISKKNLSSQLTEFLPHGFPKGNLQKCSVSPPKLCECFVTKLLITKKKKIERIKKPTFGKSKLTVADKQINELPKRKIWDEAQTNFSQQIRVVLNNPWNSFHGYCQRLSKICDKELSMYLSLLYICRSQKCEKGF